MVRIADSGLGMNDTDRRMANMRLQAGGEVSPDNARHMGLFVVGRIAARHGIRVGLRGPAANEAGSGTTAEIYLPPDGARGLGRDSGGRRDRRPGTGGVVAECQTRHCDRSPRCRTLPAARSANQNGSENPDRRSRCCRVATRFQRHHRSS